MKKSSRIILATTALIAGIAAGSASFADTVQHTTTTISPAETTTVRKTTTATTPMGTTSHTSVTTAESVPAASVTKTVTTDPVDGTVSTTVTTDTPVTTKSSVAWESEQHTVAPDGSRTVNLMDFDLNGDKILTRAEVGQKLFKLYDTDGNNVIDNIEFERPAVLTVLPVEKTTTISYDFDGNGSIDQQDRTYQTFLDYTSLSRFDGDKDGMSPHEFTNRYFNIADINNDKVVDLDEWIGSYNATVDAKNKEDARFNK